MENQQTDELSPEQREKLNWVIENHYALLMARQHALGEKITEADKQILQVWEECKAVFGKEQAAKLLIDPPITSPRDAELWLTHHANIVNNCINRLKLPTTKVTAGKERLSPQEQTVMKIWDSKIKPTLGTDNAFTIMQQRTPRR